MLFQFVLDWWSIRQLQKIGIIFEPIYYGENEDTGRSGYGETYKEAYDYAASCNSDGNITVLNPIIKVSKAWKCYCQSAPTIKAFGQSKIAAYAKLDQFQEMMNASPDEG